MKTLIITLEYPPQIGGIASYVYSFAKHLNPDEVVVYAPKQKWDKEFDDKEIWRTYRQVPFGFVWPHWFRLYRQIKKIVKSEKIERIYVHQILPVGYVAYFIKKFKKIPFTIFLHGTDLEMGTKISSKHRKIIKLCRAADQVVVNSEFLKNKLLNKVEGLNNIVVVYPCPGDQFMKPLVSAETEVLRTKLALNGKKALLTVARMAEGKGYPHLIRLMPQILQKVPNLVWIIIGDGPKKKVILEMIQKFSLQNVVRYMGNISYEDLPQYYALADVFTLLTHRDENNEEAWGTVFLEASAMGLPIVAGRAGGVEEAVINLRTGLLVDAYQDASVVAALTDLLREKEFAIKMGTAGRERVQQEFTWKSQIIKLK